MPVMLLSYQTRQNQGEHHSNTHQKRYKLEVCVFGIEAMQIENAMELLLARWQLLNGPLNQVSTQLLAFHQAR